ncbi:MAG: hypothetical protein EAZ89_21440, partial [Bacteroidetes bacterium]
MKDGNQKATSSQISLSPISLKASIEGPIKKDTAAYFVSGRLCNLLPVSALAGLLSSGDRTARYYFYDLYAKLTYQPNFRNKLQVSAYAGEDNLFFGEESAVFRGNIRQKWGNKLGALRWSHLWSNTFFSTLTLSFTQFAFQTEGLSASYEQGNISEQSEVGLITGVKDLQLKLDTQAALPRQHTLRWGFQGIQHYFTPGLLRLREQDFIAGTVSDQLLGEAERITREYNIYLEDEFRALQNRLFLNAGLVYSGYITEGKHLQAWQPRVSLRWMAGKTLAVKVGYGGAAQFLHLLSNSTFGLPTDVWVPATRNVPGQYTRQISAGAVWQATRSWEVNAEVYYKHTRNLITYAEGATLLTASSNWQQSVAQNGQG